MKEAMRKIVCQLIVIALIGLFEAPSFATVDIGSMTWTPRSDWINVKLAHTQVPDGTGINAYGDGVHDDTAAIQSVLTYISLHYNGRVYLPPGTYKITQTLLFGGLIPNPNTNPVTYSQTTVYGDAIIGSGNLTTIEWAGAAGGAMFHTQDCSNVMYRGFIIDGMNVAGCGFEQFSLDGHYDGNYRYENISFRNFTANGTYLPAGHAGVPGAGIAGGFVANSPGPGYLSIQADSMVYNCRFSNCNIGFLNCWEDGNIVEWLIDGCEFDNCVVGADFANGGDDTVQNCHFQNSTWSDVVAYWGTRIRHCTSQGSDAFYWQVNDSYATDVIQDCWVDGWTDTDFAIRLGCSGGEMLMDNTFTNAPAGSAGVVASYEGWDWYQYMIVSNNYASNFPSGMGLFSNAAGTNIIKAVTVPPGTRMGSITSPSQTFLNTSNFSDSTHILDVTQSPYNADSSGNTDASSAVQAALNAASTANNGSVVYFPAGKYLLTVPLTISGGNYTVQGAHGGDSMLFWRGSDNSTMLSISNPMSVLVDSLAFYASDNTVNGIKETATGPSSVDYRELYFTQYNGGANGAQFVLSSLPSGSSVYLDHVSGPLTTQNCGPANITGRFLENTEVNVSGTAPKTGLLGFTFSEGGNTFDPNGYNFTVNDNQDLIMQDCYSERCYNDLQMFRGAGTGTGRVTIESYGNSTWASNMTQVNVNNYDGTLFDGPQAYGNGSTGPNIVQSGSNPINLILTDSLYSFGAPTLTLGAGANLLMDADKLVINNGTQWPLDNPTLLTGSRLLAFDIGLDHMRQLGAVDLQNRFGIATDGPPLVSYAFENDCTDETGNSNGTNHGATFGDGAVDANGAVFNGINSYVDMNNPATLPTGRAPRTLAGWAKTTNTSPGWRFFASFGTNTYGNGMFLGSYGTTLYCGGQGGDDLTVPNFWDNNWHYIVLTYDGTTASLYADGLLKTSAVKTDWNLISHAAYIGCCDDNTSFWQGSADQVQVYNYALNAADIGSLYNRARANAPLAAEWQLNETSGSTSADSSGNNDTGTWENSPTPSTDHPTNSTSPETGSLSFTAASSQDVNMGNPRALPFGLAPHTLCGWAKSAGMTGKGMIASFGNLSQSWTGMYIGADGTSLLAGFGGADLPEIPNFWDGNWHFICFAYDGTTVSLYADGTLLETQTGYWNLVPQYCYIGCNLNHQNFWNGKISDVRIYNRCLTASDVAGMSTDGELAYWKVDESTGPTAYDSSGNNLTGTWENGPTFTSDHPAAIQFPDPGSLSFNGTNQDVNFGNPASLPTGYAARTLCGWAKTTNTSPGVWRLIASFGTNTYGNGMFLGSYGTTLYCGSGRGDDLTVPNFWDNNWHFIVMTYDGTTASLYADGTLLTSAVKTDWNLIPHQACIGRCSDGTSFWQGSIDDVRIYNRALSAAEVSQLAAGNPSP